MGNSLKDQHYKNMDIRPQMDTSTFEAESVAFVVCQHFGIDTSDYSFGYVAGWSRGRELAELKASLDTIHSTAGKIINAIQPSQRRQGQELSQAPQQGRQQKPKKAKRK